jgi:hypothetical protein
MEQLQVLDLGCNDTIGDDAIEELLGLRNLERLYLDGTNVTRDGAARLSQLPRIRAVFLMRSAVDEAGVRELRNTFPAIAWVGGDDPLNVRQADRKSKPSQILELPVRPAK